MTVLRAYVAVACAIAVVLPCTARAFTPVLTQRQIRGAIAAGSALFREGRGYEAKHHVLFARQNTLRIKDGQGPIEAILVGTPYERLKFASYLSAFEGRPMTVSRALSIVHDDRAVLQFIVFAHGSDPQDRNFLTRMSSGTLDLGGQLIAASSPPARFGPALDYYDVDGAGRQFRWLGSVTFRFDLARLLATRADLDGASGTFSFRDGTGSTRRYHVDLARYQ